MLTGYLVHVCQRKRSEECVVVKAFREQDWRFIDLQVN